MSNKNFPGGRVRLSKFSRLITSKKSIEPITIWVDGIRPDTPRDNEVPQVTDSNDLVSPSESIGNLSQNEIPVFNNTESEARLDNLHESI